MKTAFPEAYERVKEEWRPEQMQALLGRREVAMALQWTTGCACHRQSSSVLNAKEELTTSERRPSNQRSLKVKSSFIRCSRPDCHRADRPSGHAKAYAASASSRPTRMKCEPCRCFRQPARGPQSSSHKGKDWRNKRRFHSQKEDEGAELLPSTF